MKAMDPNVVGVIHLRGWPGSDLANRLATLIYGPTSTRMASRDRFLRVDQPVLAETAKLERELRSLYARVIHRS